MRVEIRHERAHPALGMECIAEGVGADEERRERPADAAIEIDAAMRQEGQGKVARDPAEQPQEEMGGRDGLRVASRHRGHGDLGARLRLARAAGAVADPGMDLAQAVARQSALDRGAAPARRQRSLEPAFLLALDRQRRVAAFCCRDMGRPAEGRPMAGGSIEAGARAQDHAGRSRLRRHGRCENRLCLQSLRRDERVSQRLEIVQEADEGRAGQRLQVAPGDGPVAVRQLRALRRRNRCERDAAGIKAPLAEPLEVGLDHRLIAVELVIGEAVQARRDELAVRDEAEPRIGAADIGDQRGHRHAPNALPRSSSFRFAMASFASLLRL